MLIIERTKDTSAEPVDDMVTIISMHSHLKPNVYSETEDDFGMMLETVRNIAGGSLLVNIESYTGSNGNLRCRTLPDDNRAMLLRNGVVFATLDTICDRLSGDIEKQYYDRVKNFMHKRVAYMNGDLFIVKQVEDDKVVCSSDICYGIADARKVARDIDATEKISVFP